MRALFDTTPAIATGTTLWRIARDGDPTALDLFSRHYSRPGEHVHGASRGILKAPRKVLVTPAEADRKTSTELAGGDGL